MSTLSLTSFTEDISDMLPTSAVLKGWMLVCFYTPSYSDTRKFDQIAIFDQNMKELYKWNYEPSLTEIFEKCQELEMAE